MSVLSTISCALLSAVTAFTLVSAAGCGTDAKGVDDCRDIEQTRCTAAKNCGLVKDASECQNYYRDQCLHGLAVSPPSSTVLNACVATIRAAGVCALEGADTVPTACSMGSPSQTATTAASVCEIVTNPEKTSECAFLVPASDAGAGGSGGSSGTGGSSGSGGSGDTGAAAGASGTGDGGSAD